MDKKILKSIKDLKNASTIVIVGAVIGVVLTILAVVFLLFPQYQQLNEIQGKNNVEKSKQQKIGRNLQVLGSLDKERIASYSATVDRLLPEEADHVRVVALLQIVAAGAGGSITNVTATNTTAAPKGKTPAVGEKQVIGSGGTATSGTTAPKTAARAKNSYEISGTFLGSFNSLLNFFKALRGADRVIGVTSLAIQKSSGDTVTANLTFSLPLDTSKSESVAPDEDLKTLTAVEEQKISDVLKGIIYDAAPARLPASRSNPFAPY